MSIIFNPGTGGDLKSITLEHAALELWILAMNAESNRVTADPTYQRQFSVQVSTAGGSATTTLSARIGTKAETDSAGNLTVGLS